MKGYQIDMALSLEESLRKVIVESISYIQDQIEKREDDVNVPVHETRRTIKRIRAVLKLIRDEIGYSNYYRENIIYRDLSKRLSSLRDSYVLMKTINDFHKEAPGEFPVKETRQISGALEKKLESDLGVFLRQDGGFDRVLDDLEVARRRVSQYCKTRDDFCAIRAGIERIYRRGYRYLKIIRKKHSQEQFHEYRKNTKYLLYQMELIKPAYPKLIKAYSGTIDDHADILGDTRDYECLSSFITAGIAKKEFSSSSESLLPYVHKRIDDLMQGILPEAYWIYAEKPSGFIKRISTYWKFR